MGKEGWHKEDIKAAIRKRGITVRELSIRYGLSPTTTREALIRKNRSGEQAIASFLGVAASELWPDRYNEDGTPKYLRRPRRSTRRRRPGHQEKATKV